MSNQYNRTHLLEDLKRDAFGSINNGMTYRGSFKNFCRLSSSDFNHLLRLIGPRICKDDTRLRDAISLNERLAIFSNWGFVPKVDVFNSEFISSHYRLLYLKFVV